MPADPSQKVRAYDPTLARVERTGQLLLTCTIILFVTLGILRPEPYAKVWQLVIAHIVGGRAGNVLLGINLEFPRMFLFFQCCLEDIIILLIFYPPIVVGYRRAVEWRTLGPTLVSIRATADRHKSKIEPYGVFGLMVFVIFPFWSTGALVGAVVGYLLNMRRSVTFAAVMTGNVIAVALWVWLFDQIDAISSRLTTGFLVILLLGILLSAVFAHFRHLRKERRLSSGQASPSDEEKSKSSPAPDDD